MQINTISLENILLSEWIVKIIYWETSNITQVKSDSRYIKVEVTITTNNKHFKMAHSNIVLNLELCDECKCNIHSLLVLFLVSANS